MALSLVCQDCKAQLRDVKEMQQHTDATGHTNFSESVEPVLNIHCEECGKPCRSQTEQDLHIKRTGHTSFTDKTKEQVVLDTETEMVEAAREIKETNESSPSKADDKPIEMVPASVNTDFRQQLEDMGFSGNKSTRALHYTESSSLEAALAWLEAHENDTDLEEPFLVPKEAAKPKLTPEEARQKAEELIRRNKAKKEVEERELERLREQERIRSGKELLKAKRMEEDLQLKRNLEARKREKEEEARAKEKIRLKLAEDRAERRRKLGLPEKLTPEEEAQERAKEAEKEAAKRKPIVATKPVAATEKMRAALVQMKKQANGDDTKSSTAFKTLMKYIANIAQNPSEEKFRSIKLDNAAFQSRVAVLPASSDFLRHVGFEQNGSTLTLSATSISIDVLNGAGEQLSNAINNPMFGVL